MSGNLLKLVLASAHAVPNRGTYTYNSNGNARHLRGEWLDAIAELGLTEAEAHDMAADYRAAMTRADRERGL